MSSIKEGNLKTKYIVMFDGSCKQFDFLYGCCIEKQTVLRYIYICYFFILSFIQFRAPRRKYLKTIINIKYAGSWDIAPCNIVELLRLIWGSFCLLDID